MGTMSAAYLVQSIHFQHQLQPAAENDEETNETSSPDGDSQADQAEVPFLGATN